MPTTIDSLLVTLGLDASAFDRAQKASVEHLRKLEDQSHRTTKEMQHGADQVGDRFNKAKNVLLEFGLAAAGITGFKEFVSTMVTGNAELGRASMRLGMSARDLDAFGAAMKTVGGNASDFLGSLQSIEAGIARIPWDPSIIKPIGYLGAANAVDLRTGHVDIFKLADDLKRDVQAMGMQRTMGLAQQMGIDQHTFMLLIKGGDAVRSLVNQMRSLSGVTRDNVAAASALQSEWAQLEQALSGLRQNAFGNLATTLVPLTHLLNEGAEALKRVDDSTQGTVSSVAALSVGTATLERALEGVGKVLGMSSTGGALSMLSKILGRALIGWDLFSHADSLNGGEGAALTAMRARAGSRSIPRNLRNNNPGNIEYGPWARAHGATGSDGRFARFPTMKAGMDAQLALIGGDVSSGYNTLRKLIGYWSPASENGQANTDAYIRDVSQQTGIKPNQILDPRDYVRVAEAMERHEAGSHVETHIGHITVNSRATDAHGVAKDMHKALQDNTLINSSIAGIE